MDTHAVRPMTTGDIGIVATWMAATPLWQRYGLNEADVWLELEAALKRAELLLVADVGADGVACGMAWCVLNGAFARSAYLRLFGVRREYNGQGIGTALLVEIERHVSEVCDTLFLLTSDFNSPAQQFYQQQGYQQVGALPNYVLPDVAELIFWKRLQRIV